MCSVSQPVPFDGREKWKKASLVERDARPVAIDAKVEKILHLLENDALQIIAVVGMGGIGKTFLLQNVYNHPKLRQRFHKTIWLSISLVYSVMKLQYHIASHLDLDVKTGGVTSDMNLLSDQDSWNLFCLHAFPDDQQNRPSEEIDKVAHQVERECKRLPLAVKTVAASMASQKLLSNWESKLRQLKEVSDPESDNPIIPILGLSDNVLPAVLKPCFLYFSFFREDEEIDVEYLIYLWMAEGFIPKGKEQWTIGWSYLKQLNNLCLVEVEEDEDLKSTCKIHDLLLDLVISISKENACAFKLEEASAVGCRHQSWRNCQSCGMGQCHVLRCLRCVRADFGKFQKALKS